MYIFNILTESFRNMGDSLGSIGQVISTTWFIIFPVAFYYVFKILWMDYIQDKFWSSVEWTMLEIIPPREIEKSPQPMESIFSGMHGVRVGFATKDIYLKGAMTMKFSLEIASNEGNVHFYIRTPKNFVSLLEAHIYAQYPDAEVIEVPDYVDEVPKVVPNKNWDLWGADFELVKADPYPIKTYKWFEEDVTGKMIDPLAGLIETIGKLGPNQKIWFQMIIIPEEETWANTGRELVNEMVGRKKKESKGFFQILFGEFKDIVSGIMQGFTGPIEFPSKEENGEEPFNIEQRLTPGEKEVLQAVEQAIGKNVYQVKMRFIYLGRRENFDKSAVSSFVGGLKQFQDQNLNGLKPEDSTKTYANYLFTDERMRYRQRKILRRYRDRDPSGPKTFILNTEELATVFHLPDMAVEAPALRRVQARRGGAPINLPT